MQPPRRHPRLALLVVVAACIAWSVPAQRLELLLLRELYRLGEMVGITPTAASGAGSLAGQILGFNYSRPPKWYGLAARSLALTGAFLPALLPALALRGRLASGRRTARPSRLVAAARLLAAAVVFSIVSITLHVILLQPLWSALLSGFERLGASATRISGLLVMTASGPFTGGSSIDALGNLALRHGPATLFAALAAAAAALAHARLWRTDDRRDAAAGLCVACGYDLRGTPAGSPCPECGTGPDPRRGMLRS